MAATSTTISLASTFIFTPASSNTNSLIIQRTNHFSTPSLTSRRHLIPLSAHNNNPIKSTNTPKSSGEQKWVHEGVVTESLPNGMFLVRLDNTDMVLGYISGRIRRSSIRILPGDRVKIEVTRYDSTRGRIVYRLRGKDLNDVTTA